MAARAIDAFSLKPKGLEDDMDDDIPFEEEEVDDDEVDDDEGSFRVKNESIGDDEVSLKAVGFLCSCFVHQP